MPTSRVWMIQKLSVNAVVILIRDSPWSGVVVHGHLKWLQQGTIIGKRGISAPSGFVPAQRISQVKQFVCNTISFTKGVTTILFFNILLVLNSVHHPGSFLIYIRGTFFPEDLPVVCLTL